MDDQTNQQSQPIQSNKKEERIDELDIFGGLLIKLLQNSYYALKKLFKPK